LPGYRKGVTEQAGLSLHTGSGRGKGGQLKSQSGILEKTALKFF